MAMAMAMGRWTLPGRAASFSAGPEGLIREGVTPGEGPGESSAGNQLPGTEAFDRRCLLAIPSIDIAPRAGAGVELPLSRTPATLLIA